MTRTMAAAAIIAIAATSTASAATRAERDRAYTERIRTAPVDARYSRAVGIYTGWSYGIATINELWPRYPHHQTSQRAAMLDAAKAHHLPLRLLIGIYGMESGFGRFRCYFGLTGYFPRTGTSGSFTRDAQLAAGILQRLIGRKAVA